MAWHHLGWKPSGFSEVEPFPSAVLSHHYPEVTNFGDMTQFKEWDLGNEAIDILVGGTPCQSFSVAGLRQGLKDPRGNLMLTYLGIAERFRPRWIVWENVSGVLSSAGGRDFGTFLGALVELGYGFAYRVLDAQWFGVAQRRRRVFVVGCFGNATSAAKVLFESESVSRNPAPSREKGKEVARCFIPSVAGSLDTECGGGKLTHQSIANGHVIGTITARMFNSLGARNVEEGALLPVKNMVLEDQGGSVINVRQDGTVGTLRSETHGHEPAVITYGFEPGIAKREGEPNRFSKEMSPTLRSAMGDNQAAVAIGTDCYNGTITGDVACTMGTPGSSVNASGPTIMHQMAVRRLTPIECERLQGFPDGYTAIPWRKKPADQCPDGPRYKALGNSMAVPVMRWIGERIDKVEKGAAP